MRKSIITLLIACMTFGSVGCVTYVFNKPATISTKSTVAKHVKLLKEVKVEYTDMVILFIPLVKDPRAIYDSLLEEAKKAGGNAVIDVQIRNKKDGMVGCVGLFLKNTVEAAGTAVLLE